MADRKIGSISRCSTAGWGFVWWINFDNWLTHGMLETKQEWQGDGAGAEAEDSCFRLFCLFWSEVVDQWSVTEKGIWWWTEHLWVPLKTNRWHGNVLYKQMFFALERSAKFRQTLGATIWNHGSKNCVPYFCQGRFPTTLANTWGQCDCCFCWVFVREALFLLVEQPFYIQELPKLQDLPQEDVSASWRNQKVSNFWKTAEIEVNVLWDGSALQTCPSIVMGMGCQTRYQGRNKSCLVDGEQ